ncbi:MAG: MgtC/SapB family protein [Myxococcales bacterium]|nr:MgtC/SapB family protein [Myxococcales bacterium]
MGEILGVEWSEVWNHLLHLGAAFGLAIPIGWDREQSRRGPGLRTFPLVAMGSCAFLLVGRTLLEGSESHARLLYGLMTGIGFIGGGSILKHGGTISGTATAASIWNTGALGAAVAWDRYEIALVLSAANFVVLRYGGAAKHLVGHTKDES